MNPGQCPKDESQWARPKYHARWPAKQLNLAHRVDSQFLFQRTIDPTIGLPELQEYLTGKGSLHRVLWARRPNRLRT